MPVSGFKGLLPCQCKTQCVLRIWQKLYAGFRDRLGRGSRRAWGTDTGAGLGQEKMVSDFGDRQGRFPCTGVGIGNPDAEQFGIGGGVYDR